MRGYEGTTMHIREQHRYIMGSSSCCPEYCTEPHAQQGVCGSEGTTTHMPLELLMEGKLNQSADVYAFGVIMWEM